MCLCVCMYMDIYIYIYRREREREREYIYIYRERERELSNQLSYPSSIGRYDSSMVRGRLVCTPYHLAHGHVIS